MISDGMAVIKKDLGGMRVRINVLGGMAVICRYYYYILHLSAKRYDRNQ
jgi:hypothetical protein